MYGHVAPPTDANPDGAIKEAFLDGKDAAHKERAAKATTANKNKPELRGTSRR